MTRHHTFSACGVGKVSSHVDSPTITGSASETVVRDVGWRLLTSAGDRPVFVGRDVRVVVQEE